MLLSIATNACAGDQARLRHVIPHWLRTFGAAVEEVVIVVDPVPATGRIAALHGAAQSLETLWTMIQSIEAEHPKVRHVVLDAELWLDSTSRKWFGSAKPLRCQAGTPIFAFVQAIEEARSDLVMRVDCDMLFQGARWLPAAEDLLAADMDIVEPPRPTLNAPGDSAEVSSRAFLLRRSKFSERCLPLKCARLDPLRVLHRALQGRPPWLALEQTLERERLAGRVRHQVLDSEFGFSIHVAERNDMEADWFGRAVRAIEAGEIPTEQRQNPNFLPSVWREWSATRDRPD